MLRPPSTGTRTPTTASPTRPRPLRPVPHRQLVLVELPIDLDAGLRRGFPPPPDPVLAAALWEAVRDHAIRHGWRPGMTERVQHGVRILLGLQHTPGAPFRASDVALLSRLGSSVSAVTAVLAELGMLEDDSVPAIERWFPVFIAELPQEMQAELEVWFDVRRHGSRVAPRSRPRSDHTVSSQLRFAMPALRSWAKTHTSLRAIAREDVYAALPPSGSGRQTMLQGLRSIFRVLKARRLVFVNPTTHLSVPHANRPAPPAVDLDALRAALDGDDVTRAALAALLAFHGVRLYQLCQVRLADVRDGRLHVGEQVILLAPGVRDRLDAWLTERAARWPRTVNSHLFIHYRNAHTTSPASPWWISKRLGMSGQAIRQDRILDEAHATKGDLRRLCDLFGLSSTTASYYASTVIAPHEADWEHAAAADAPAGS
jgi:site-specific recombinase XerC